MEAVKQNGWALIYASERLRDNADFVMEAVRQSGELLQHASDRLQDDAGIVMEAVKSKWLALNYASTRLKDDAIIVMEAVKQDGRALSYASGRLQDDAHIVMEAVRHYGRALKHASVRLRDDADIVLEAMKKSIDSCEYASDRLRSDVSFVAQGIMGCERSLVVNGLHGIGTRWFIINNLNPMFPSLQILQMAADARNSATPLSFVENQGANAAQECAEWCKIYHSERIWLLSQVVGPLPTTLIKSIDAFSERDLSRWFGLANQLMYYAPILSALECKGVSWIDMLENEDQLVYKIRASWYNAAVI